MFADFWDGEMEVRSKELRSVLMKKPGGSRSMDLGRGWSCPVLELGVLTVVRQEFPINRLWLTVDRPVSTVDRGELLLRVWICSSDWFGGQGVSLQRIGLRAQ